MQWLHRRTSAIVQIAPFVPENRIRRTRHRVYSSPSALDNRPAWPRRLPETPVGDRAAAARRDAHRPVKPAVNRGGDHIVKKAGASRAFPKSASWSCALFLRWLSQFPTRWSKQGLSNAMMLSQVGTAELSCGMPATRFAQSSPVGSRLKAGEGPSPAEVLLMKPPGDRVPIGHVATLAEHAVAALEGDQGPFPPPASMSLNLSDSSPRIPTAARQTVSLSVSPGMSASQISTM